MLFLSVPESIRALLSFRRVDSMIFSDSDICGFIVILGAFGKLRSLCQLDEMLLASDERASLTRISWVRSILYLPSLTQSQTACLVSSGHKDFIVLLMDPISLQTLLCLGVPVTFNLDPPKIGPPGTNFSETFGPPLKNLFPLYQYKQLKYVQEKNIKM